MLKTWRWVASALISATVLAIIPASAKADGTQHFTDINNTFYSQKIINDCFYQAQPAEFKKELTSQPWLWMTKDSNTGVAIGRYISPGGSNLDGSTNGWIKCNNEGVMNQATRSFLEYAKYADIDAFVKELGYTVITKQECARLSTGTYPTCVENRNVEFYSLNGKKANMAAIQSKTPPQSSPALYFALNTIFTRECVSTSGMQITRKVIVEDPPGSQKYISQDASVTIKSISPGNYNNGGVTYGSTAAPLTAYDYNNQNTNCKDLSAKIDGLTGATLAFNSQNPDLAITASATATTSPIKTGAGEPTEAAPTCTVEAVGWIICPVTNFLAKIVDGAYGLVEQLLVFNGFTSPENSSMRSAWEGMRNIANVFFVIGFLIIVFSQVTSIGISNYGIKKLLPKLVITAILVNLSYTLCALAVDVSNLLGSGMKDLFGGFEFNAKPNQGIFSGGSWLDVTGGLLAGTLAVGVSLYVGLSALLPALIAAIVSVVTAFLVLTLRQALIILLIVISPLAIVAMLLPNTENWFKKWKSTFTTMLLIYPIIGLLFGASALASSVITNSSDDFFVQIMGALIGVLPLAITPVLLKASGGILGKFGAMINNPNKGPFDRMRKGAEKYRENRQGIRKAAALTGSRRVFGARQFKRAQRKEYRDAARNAGLESAQAQFGITDPKSAQYVNLSQQHNANKNAINSALSSKYVNAVAAGTIQPGQAMSATARGDEDVAEALAAQQAKAIKEAIQDVEITSTIKPGDIAGMKKAFEDAVKVGDTVKARAYQNMLYNSGAHGHEAWQSSTEALESKKEMSADMREKLQHNILSNHSGMKTVNNAAMRWAVDSNQTATLQDYKEDSATYSKLTNDELIASKAFVQEKAISLGVITKERASDMTTNQRFDSLSEDVKKEIRRIAATP